MVFSSKNSTFTKEQEASWIIASLAETLTTIPVVGPVLF